MYRANCFITIANDFLGVFEKTGGGDVPTKARKEKILQSVGFCPAKKILVGKYDNAMQVIFQASNHVPRLSVTIVTRLRTHLGHCCMGEGGSYPSPFDGPINK